MDIERIARLSGLELSDEEKARFSKELKTILDYFSKIDEVEVSELQASYHEHLGYQPLRADEPRDGLPRDEVLRNAPAVEDGYIKIPPILRG